MSDASELITIGQAVELLGVQRNQVDRWIRAGRLKAFTLPPAYKRQGNWRYVERAQVEALALERSLTRPAREKDETKLMSAIAGEPFTTEEQQIVTEALQILYRLCREEAQREHTEQAETEKKALDLLVQIANKHANA